MNGHQDKLIETIQASGYQAAIVVTGGGSGAVHALLSHPGASRFVLEASIPYSDNALTEYLGEVPASACSEETATRLAACALNRASRITDHASHAIGVACTAALQTNRIRKGKDRAFICLQSSERRRVQRIDLEPGTRAEQEGILSVELLKLIAEFIGQES
jgi:nicotinamide mononucleotide (NMN) deamidase PncC